jgi:hypothetical protein
MRSARAIESAVDRCDVITIKDQPATVRFTRGLLETAPASP